MQVKLQSKAELETSGVPQARFLIINAYLACLFPIQLWSLFNLLHEVPAWWLQLNAWDLMGVISYVQMFVLFESIIIFLPLVLLSAILPPEWFSDKFVAHSAGIVFLATIWFIFAHVNDPTLRSWGYRQYLPWIGLFFFSQILLFFSVHCSQKFESIIVSFVDRLVLVSVVYLFIDLVSVLIVVLRNV
jgi:hypothetical protein